VACSNDGADGIIGTIRATPYQRINNGLWGLAGQGKTVSLKHVMRA